MASNFCNGPFWDSNLTWNTSNPNFTPCFRDAVIPSIPCGFLWLSTPFWLLWTSKYKAKLKPKFSKSWTSRLTLIFVLKVILNWVILVNTLGQFAWRLIKSPMGLDGMYSSDIFYPLILFLSAFLALIMMIGEKKNCIRTSIPLSLFWPLLSFTLLPQFKVDIEYLIENHEDYGKMVLTCTLLPFCLLLFLANLWPDVEDLEAKEKAEDLAPNNTNSFLSSVFLSWMTPLIWKGYKSPLTQSDLFHLPSKIDVDANVEKFKSEWEKYLKKNGIKFDGEGKKTRAKLWLPLMNTIGWRFLLANCLGLIHYSVTFLGPQILKQLINLVEDPNEYSWKGYLYSVLLFIVYFTSTVFFTDYLVHMYSVAITVRSAVVSSIMRKMLKLSNTARKQFTLGQITNLVSVDSQRLLEAIPYLCILWAAPYQATLAMTLVYQELGPAAMAGVAVLAVLVPINAIGSKLGEILQRSQLKAKDSRIKLMNEILSGIKVLKLYAWEIPFMKRILEIRDKELKVIKKNALLNSLNNFTYACSPILITMGAFSAYALSGDNVLTPQKVFVSMAYFNLVRIPLMLFPHTLKEVIKSYVSAQRITDFLNAEELDSLSIDNVMDSQENAIEFENVSVAWEDKAILEDLSFGVPKGSLTAIVGSVGSGKSSLISALLGEMHKIKGRIAMHGTLAYVAQQAWIQNLTLKENILFGKKYVEEGYRQVLEACSLIPDLKILVQGDETEIGENGINLSGGQKQRVSLARAIYSDADIYLLDDPLSAVDAHVGKHIFDKVISNKQNSLLANKTRVWVTNNLSFLPQVDHVIVLENGKIKNQGAYKDVLKTSTLKNLVRQQSLEKEEEDTTSEETIENINEVKNNKEDGKLVKAEQTETGRVKFSVYLSYLKSLGYKFFANFVFLIAMQESLHLVGNIWLANWSDANVIEKNESRSVSHYLWIYAAIGMSEMVIKLGNDLTYYFRCARASKLLHKNILDNVMRSPMSFFDSNPTGRIMNRFTSDLDTVDQMIPMEILDFTWCLIECIVVIFLICFTTPAFIGVIIPLLILYFFIQRIYIASSRQLKRLYSISKSPIFSHFSETTNGAQTIRAYKHQERFIQENQDRVSVNVNSIYLNFMSNRWLGMRLENIGNCIIFFTALFAVLAREKLSGGEAGLSITCSLQIIGALVWVVRQACQLETDCVAIERIMEFTKTEQEAPWTNDSTKISEDWPSQGKIQFQEYKTRYRKELDLVLKGISLNIDSGEKLGICGRTGAGKSSLTLALFRIIEPVSGKIIIDDQDIAKLGLHNLRSKLTIIPQDPVLFAGDLRFNLDPMEEHDDDSIWRSLEVAHLKNHVVENLPNGLSSEVTEGGSNFSVGQRQLICLARALLRKTKILIMDEATATVDEETDELIQSTLRKEFADCTVLTIAHRLNTILDSDRIAVLKNGALEEIDAPKELLSDPGSSFRSMAMDAHLI